MEQLSPSKITNAHGLGNDQVRTLVKLGRQYGLDDRQILANTDLLYVDVDTACLEVDAEQELTVIRNLVVSLEECPFELGFKAGLQCKLHSFGLIGQSMLSSSTVKDALGIFARYIDKIFYFSKFDISTEDGRVTVHFYLNLPLEEKIALFVLGRDYGVTAYVHELVMGKKTRRVYEIGFTYPEQKGMALLSEYFDCPIKFNQQSNFMIGDVDNLRLEMPYSNPLTARILEQQCHQRIKQRKQLESTQGVRKKIWALLEKSGERELTKQDAAKALNISTRTMNRRLQEENTNWRNTLSEFRIRKACRLLQFTELSIQLIADSVGFSSASAFSTAFSRYKKCTPVEYRNSFLGRTARRPNGD